MNRDREWRWTGTWGQAWGVVDVRFALLVVPTLFHLRWWTVLTAVTVMVVLILLRLTAQVTPAAAWRYLFWGVQRWCGRPMIRAQVLRRKDQP